jgi:hypothetical protein
LRAWRSACAAGLWLAGVAAACAEIDIPSPDLLSGGFRPEEALYFSGFDIWRNGYAGFGGIESSPAAFGDDAVLLRLTALDGIDIYQTPKTTYRTQTLSGALMVGGRVKRGNFELKGFAGIDLEARILLNPTLGWIERLQAGLRIAAEAWWEPSDLMMLSAALSMTTNSAGRTARIAAGYRLLDQAWVGPEMAVASDLFSTQYRAGVHVTGWRFEGFEWSAAAGYVYDSFNRGGVYGRIGVSTGRRDSLEGMVTP